MHHLMWIFTVLRWGCCFVAVSIVFLKCVGNCHTTAFIHKTSLKSLYNMLAFNCKSCLKEAKSLLFMISIKGIETLCAHQIGFWTLWHHLDHCAQNAVPLLSACFSSLCWDWVVDACPWVSCTSSSDLWETETPHIFINLTGRCVTHGEHYYCYTL